MTFFFPQKIFFPAGKIFFSPRKIFFLAGKIFFFLPKIFFFEKNGLSRPTEWIPEQKESILLKKEGIREDLTQTTQTQEHSNILPVKKHQKPCGNQGFWENLVAAVRLYRWTCLPAESRVSDAHFYEAKGFVGPYRRQLRPYSLGHPIRHPGPPPTPHRPRRPGQGRPSALPS